MTATRRPADEANEARDETQRLDKWLWYARVVKTRTLASHLVAEGRVRLNSARVLSPAKRIRIGDVLTIALAHEVRVLRIVAAGVRRGPFAEAQTLLEDLSRPDAKDET